MGLIAKKPENPFFTRSVIPNRYFCDRRKETEKIISLIEGGSNIVLTADRRIGKSSLLHHILLQPEIQTKYNCLYVDVYDTGSPEDFVNAIKCSMFDSGIRVFSDPVRKEIEAVTREYSGTVGLGVSPLSLEGSLKVEKVKSDMLTIDRIFSLLSRTKRPNLIVFDEFQQVEEYEHKITALLRSKIQAMNNSRFIYSGSSVYMLSSMFLQYNQPFYNSSALFGLKPISKESYLDFCADMFSLYDKGIEPDAISFAYDLFWGNIQNLQHLMKISFSSVEKGSVCDVRAIEDSVNDILDDRNEVYETAFSRAGTERNKKVLTCIAAEGLAKGMTSSAMLERYGLGASSSVNDALKALSSSDKNYVVRMSSGSYCLNDKFFELWISRRLGLLDAKFSGSAQLFSEYLKSKEVTVSVIKSAFKFQPGD